MTTATATPPLMTAEEFEALPDDGVERRLIRGVLYERRPAPGGDGMTKRNRFHSRVMMRVGHLLLTWADRQPEPRGQVVGGEAGFILRRNPDSTAGIDVAYVSPATVAVQTDATTLFDGPPVLAVEILSPNNTHQEVVDKLRDYLTSGVAVVWVVDPDLQTVAVYRPAGPLALFGPTQTLTGDPELRGFAGRVADFFR